MNEPVHFYDQFAGNMQHNLGSLFDSLSRSSVIRETEVFEKQ